MWKVLIAVLLVCTGAVSVLAQEQADEIAGTVGRTIIGDQTPPNTNFFNNTVHFGHGTSFEVNYAHRFRTLGSGWGALWLEVPAIFNLDEDLNYGANQIPKDYSSFFITPSARLNLIPDLAVSPWVSFGGGYGHFSASNDLVFFGPNTGHRIKNTGVLQGGVGFDVRLPKIHRLKFRFEARDYLSGMPPLNIDTGRDHQHNYYVAAGGVFRF